MPRSFAIKDSLLHLIVQAFKEVGQEGVTEDFLEKITSSIRRLESKVVDTQLRFAPVWIQKIIANLYKANTNVD